MLHYQVGRIKLILYLSPMRAAEVQESLRIRAVLPELPLLAHTSSESRGTFRQKARSLASLNGWACAVKICHDGMLEDTNSLDAAQVIMIHFTETKEHINACIHKSSIGSNDRSAADDNHRHGRYWLPTLLPFNIIFNSISIISGLGSDEYVEFCAIK